jgi:hypothetical protein
MRVARAQALRAAALTPRTPLRTRASAPALARRAASAAPRAAFHTPASRARALLPALPPRRGFCGDSAPLMAPQRAHLRPRGVAVAAVASLGVAAAGALAARGFCGALRRVRRAG